MIYSIRLWQEMVGDELWWIATHPELDGSLAQGKTMDEALAALADVRETLLTHDRECNLPVPEGLVGSAVMNVHVVFDCANGNFVPWEARS